MKMNPLEREKETTSRRRLARIRHRASAGRTAEESSRSDWELAGTATPEDWAQLERYLRWGADVGVCRVPSRHESPEGNGAEFARRCAASDAQRVVDRVIDALESGRHQATEARLRALSLAAALGDAPGKSSACAAVSKVCRTSEELFRFAENVTSLRGWGRSLRRAVADWYRMRYADDLAYQVVHCSKRAGWSHRDLLRLSHPTPATQEQAAVFRWILDGAGASGRRTVLREIGKNETTDHGEGMLDAADPEFRRYRSVTYPSVGELPRLLRGVDALRGAETLAEVVRVIAEHDLPREAIPAVWLREVEVWEALLYRMPLRAVIRDLGLMSAAGLLAGGGEAAWWLENRLQDRSVLRTSGLHPVALYLARRTYESGRMDAGRVRWEPVEAVVRALDDAFYASMRNVAPIGKPTVVAVDTSVSTRASRIPGTDVPVRDVLAALVLTLATTEPECFQLGFVHSAPPRGGVDALLASSTAAVGLLSLRSGQRVEDILRDWDSLTPAAPDPALPVTWALRNGARAEAFKVLTDGDVWPSDRIPENALAEYRDATGLDARLVVAGLSGAEFRTTTGADARVLDVIGFDGTTPSLMADFLRS